MFRRYVGVPVKWVLCRYRLQQAALEIESHPNVDFADLAVRLGGTTRRISSTIPIHARQHAG